MAFEGLGEMSVGDFADTSTCGKKIGNRNKNYNEKEGKNQDQKAVQVNGNQNPILKETTCLV
jgi:hypothetical protein